MSDVSRGQWNTRLGFILAAVGSAVGLGNIWRFPYMTAESGGASFVFLYVVLLFIIGIPVMLAEFVIGRSSQLSPVQALAQSSQRNWAPLGFLFVLTGFTILSYYSVIAGWTLQYMMDSLGTVFQDHSSEQYFQAISAGNRAIFFHLIFMGLTTGIVVAGVENGIERAVKVLIPLLVVLLAGLAVWAYRQDGAVEGYTYYLAPDVNKLIKSYSLGPLSVPFLNLEILSDAAGQTFFTLSLGMGAMLTYSSYLSKQEDLFEETLIISAFDTGVALLAGLAIFPIIHAFNLVEKVGESTVGTLFITLPEAFRTMGGWGMFLNFAFFAMLLLAALTSGISLLEVVTSSVIDEYGISRNVAATTSGLAIFLLGVPAALNTAWLSLADKIASNLLLLLGGFMLSVYVGWYMSAPAEELRRGLGWNISSLWLGLIRYVVPPVLFLLLMTGFWGLSQDLLAQALPGAGG